jgi:hypothetical protein
MDFQVLLPRFFVLDFTSSSTILLRITFAAIPSSPQWFTANATGLTYAALIGIETFLMYFFLWTESDKFTI